MTTYFVSNDGDNSDGLTWAKAYTSLQTALTAASSGSDVVVIKYNSVPSGDLELAADTAYTTANHVSIVSASADDAGTAYTLTAMGTGAWIGNSTTNRYVRIDVGGDDKVFMWGLTLRVSGSTSDMIRLNGANSGGTLYAQNCYFWQANTGTTAHINIGGDIATKTTLEDCTLRFGHADQRIWWGGGTCELINCTISPDGVAPTALMDNNTSVETDILFTGCDLSHITNTLIPNLNKVWKVWFRNCKFGAGVTVLAAQTLNPYGGSPQVWAFDCASGDTHMTFGYYDALGSVTQDTGIYFTSGAAAESWKIVTTANCDYYHPFVTPSVDYYNATTGSAITPYFEIVRSGSATAYQNDEIWATFAAKVTSGSTKTTRYNDKLALATKVAGGAAADQAAGAGVDSWTGENATSWSGKIDSGSPITPAEIGYIRGYISVGEPSITVYVDPQIRT